MSPAPISVLNRLLADEREGTSGRHLSITGVDVVLEHDGNSVEGTSRSVPPPFPVESLRDLERVRVELQNRVQPRPLPIESPNAFDVHSGEVARSELPRFHRLLQLEDRLFLERSEGSFDLTFATVRIGDAARESRDRSSCRTHGAQMKKASAIHCMLLMK